MPPDSSETPDDLAMTAKETGKSIYDELLDTLLTGIAITIPLVITVYVLNLVLEFISNAIRPIVGLLQLFGIISEIESVFLVRLLIELDLYTAVLSFLTELITIALLIGVIFVVGTFGRNRYGERVIDYIDLLIQSIPGVGAVYKSFRRMGDVMLNEEAENFQSVKMVRCFGENMYVLGFKTSDAPPTIEDSTNNEEMVAMFLPLAPNPVTGGFLTYVPRRDVIDIDMTIEEGVRSILTSGIATGEDTAAQSTATLADISDITDIGDIHEALTTESADDTAVEDGGHDGREHGGTERTESVHGDPNPGEADRTDSTPDETDRDETAQDETAQDETAQDETDHGGTHPDNVNRDDTKRE